MLFNSIEFLIFLPAVFAIYWILPNHKVKLQNAVIVVSSYVFYGWWDWRFLSLIVFSTLVDYSIGCRLKNEEKPSTRKLLLWSSLVVNLGFLGFFKYYNFFLDSFIKAFSFLGQDIQPNSLNLILPVGISFYTFQTLSYTIDVYRNKLEPTEDFISFSAFVCFFPQLVAGPIERATNFLPQITSKRSFEYAKAVDGLRQILWGLFKKIVIADNCAVLANEIFNNYQDYNGSTLLLGAIFFAFQIYGDFSGYSDIAIGTARLFGFNLMQNFSTPYFSRDVAEFWRRWHISLSTWFRDYLYIPLGGSRGGNWMKVRNTFIIFLVSGLWHGANWTYVIWGGLNALYYLPILLLKRNRTNLDAVSKGSSWPSFKNLYQMGLTFLLTTFAWIFFRAENVGMAFSYVSEILSYSLFEMPSYSKMKTPLLLLIFFIIIEWIGRERKYAIEMLGFEWHKAMRYLFYYGIIIFILWFSRDEQEFIYFQF